jgi:DNA modification methylase
VFTDVWRILTDDGVLWLNLGDSYAAGGRGGDSGRSGLQGSTTSQDESKRARMPRGDISHKSAPGIKVKCLVGVPWMVAFALRDAGWYLRADVIWSKPNPMPESTKDRPTKSHEYIFLFSKSRRYYYDAGAIAESASLAMQAQMEQGYDGLDMGLKDYAGAGVQNPSSVKARIIANARRKNKRTGDRRKVGFNDRWDATEAEYHGKHSEQDPQAAGRRILKNVAAARAAGGDHDSPFGVTRNARSVWSIPTQPYPDAHFATFSEALPERCIKAGSRLGDMVLDPFCGSGQVAIQLGRSFVGIELNPTYAELARKRIGSAAPLFAEAL